MDPVTVTITDESVYMDYLEAQTADRLLHFAADLSALADNPMQIHAVGSATLEDLQRFAARVEAAYTQLAPDGLGDCPFDDSAASQWVKGYYAALKVGA
jgi:hypothetical protein